MKSILYLSPIEEKFLEPNLNLNTFNWLAADFGLQIKSIRYRNNNKQQLPYLLEQIADAHGFYLPNASFLSDHNLSIAILEKIKKGSILFSYINYKDGKGLEFFENFGLEISSIKAAPDRDRVSTNSSDPQKFIVVHKESQCFMDEQLFNDVHRLEVNFTYGLGCFGIAKPVLSLPFNEIYLLDDRTDRLVDLAPESNLTIMASIRQHDWLGNIFVSTSNSIFADSYVNKKIFNCIEAFDNKKFAKNLLSLFSYGLGTSLFDWNDLNRFFREIELGVAEITREILINKSPDHWMTKCIPEKMLKDLRQEKYDLTEQQIFQKLNFVQFKSIWRYNWDSFSWLFEDEESPEKKEPTFIQRINDFRSIVIHGPQNLDLPVPPQNIVDEFLAVRALVGRIQDKLNNSQHK